MTNIIWPRHVHWRTERFLKRNIIFQIPFSGLPKKQVLLKQKDLLKAEIEYLELMEQCLNHPYNQLRNSSYAYKMELQQALKQLEKLE